MSVKSKLYKCKRCGRTLVPKYVKDRSGRDTPIAIWDCTNDSCSCFYFEITKFLSVRTVFTSTTPETFKALLREV